MPAITEIPEWIIQHLREEGITTDSSLEVLSSEEVDSSMFLDLTTEDLHKCGIPTGPAKKIMGYIQQLKGS